MDRQMMTMQDVQPTQAQPESRYTKRVTEETIKKALEIMRKYKAGKERLDKRLIKNEEYWKLRHWEWMEETGNPMDIKPRSAWLFNTVMGKHADATEAYPEPNMLAREQDDEPEADMLSDIVPVVLAQNDFEETWGEVTLDKIKSGTGCYGIYWDKSKHHGLGDITIKAIPLLNLFWEPGVTDLQKSQHVFHAELRDNDQLEKSYPQLVGKLKGKSITINEYLTDDHIDTTDKSLVVDWYYHTYDDGRKKLHYCKFVNLEILYASENDDEQLTGPDGMPMGSVHETGWYAHGEYPFVLDPMYKVAGSPCGFGIIDVARSPQEQIDLLNQAIIKNAVMGATPRYLVRGNDGVINEQEFADWTKPIVHATTLGENAVMPLDVPQLSGIYVDVANSKVQELRDTTGNNDVLNGNTSTGVTSASGIAALQQAAGRSSKAMIRGSYIAYKHVVTQVIELIRQFYTVPRYFRIVGERGQNTYVQYSNARIRQQQLTGPEGPIGYRVPEFDIDVRPQQMTAYNKLAQNELAQALFGMGAFNPQLVDQSLLMLDMMDFTGKEELVDKLSQMQTMQQQMQLWQQMAMALASKYEPAMAQGLAQQAGMQMQPGAAPGGIDASEKQALAAASGGGEKEHPFVKRAKAAEESSRMPT